jgi:YHS domain-containing protein
MTSLSLQDHRLFRTWGWVPRSWSPRHRRDFHEIIWTFLHAHVEDSMSVAPQFEESAFGSDVRRTSTAAHNTFSFGFDGFCLVSLLEENGLRPGDPKLTAEHHGQTLCFYSEEQRQKFLAEPDRYWPVANGQCLVSSKEGREGGLGDPRAGVIWRGRLWFFSDRESQQRFIAMPYQYSGDL